MSRHDGEGQTFGTRLRHARKRRDWSQNRLALETARSSSGRVNISATEISRYERGKHTPRLYTMAALADALDVPLSHLTGGADHSDRLEAIAAGVVEILREQERAKEEMKDEIAELRVELGRVRQVRPKRKPA